MKVHAIRWDKTPHNASWMKAACGEQSSEVTEVAEKVTCRKCLGYACDLEAERAWRVASMESDPAAWAPLPETETDEDWPMWLVQAEWIEVT